MSTLKPAIGFLVAYGLLLAGNTVLYWSWSGDSSEAPRVVVRLVGVTLLSFALARRQRWAWWLTVVASGLGAILGAVGGAAIIFSGGLAHRVYPTVDVVVLALTPLLLIGVLVCLLLPSTRALFFTDTLREP